MKFYKILIGLSALLCSMAHAAQDNDMSVFLFDASGHAISSTSAALNAFITNTSLAVSQSGPWTTGRTWSLSSGTDNIASVQSGTWIVQPGNTANTTAWLVTGTGGTFPATQSGPWTTGRTWTLSNSTDSMTSFQGTSNWTTNVTQFGGVNLSTGTGTSGTGIPRVTVSNDSNILATQSGTWTVQQGATPTTVGNAWPVKPTDGTNVVTVKPASTASVTTDTSEVVALSPNSPLPTGSNNIGSIANVTGTVNLPTGASTLTAQNTGNTTLSTISSVQSSGAQKTQIVDASGNVIGPTMTVSGVNYLPVAQPIDITQSTINVTAQDVASSTAVGFANQSLITGTPTTSSSAAYSLNSIQTVMIIVKGTWTGTLSTEVSEDSGTTWEPRSIHVIGTSTFASAVTANVVGSMNAAAKTNVRVRATAAMTGTASITIVVSDNPSNVYVANSLKLVDGSSTPAVNMLTIKAASTAAVAADTAAVVTISPNNVAKITSNVANNGTPTQTSVSCGTGSTTLLAASAATLFLSIRNPTSASATVWVNIAGAAAVAAAPSIDLAPGAEADFSASENSYLPTAQINCISGGAAASTLTLFYK